jgi:Cdc6-like AAA superfamily ATPase
MTGPIQLIVNPISAQYIGHEIRDSRHIPSDTDHRGLVRFDSPHDRRYSDLIRELGKMVREASINSPMTDQNIVRSTTAGGEAKMPLTGVDKPRARSESPAYLRVHMPLNFARKDGSFIERTGLLREMRREISSSTSSKRILALYGAPGSGKTQLSNHYVREYWADYSAYFKFDLGSTERFSRCLKDIYPHIHSAKGSQTIYHNLGNSEADLLTAVIKWLSQPNNKSWIIVIDRIDSDTLQSHETSLRRLVGGVPHGTFVLISQSTRVIEFFQSSLSLRVSGLSDAETIKLFKQSLGSGCFDKSKGENVMSAPNRCQTN